jgi:pimeloyl-ACP methyl ester carboxylesterase
MSIRGIGLRSWAATLGFAAGAAFFATQAGVAAPLVLAEQGYFFVGGQYRDTPSGTIMDGQMYVQFQIPARQRHPFPIIFIHGQGQSGVNFLGTPDGREGWADYFLRQGYAVYVVDQPLRGRSAYHASEDGPLNGFSTKNEEFGFTHPEATGAWPNAKLHTQWPGAGVKGDPVFDQFYASQLDSSLDDRRMDELNRDADAALLDKIGPAIVLTHSRSGPFGWLLADARPKLVKAIVAVEPWGSPFRDSFPKVSDIKRPWGITVAPITYDPPVTDPAELAPQEVPGLAGSGNPSCFMASGPQRTLPNLVGVPVLIVTAEASYHTLYDACTSKYLKRAGVHNEWMRLGAIGIHGNAHMMMIERNNQEIAAAIENWLSRTLPPVKLQASKTKRTGWRGPS